MSEAPLNQTPIPDNIKLLIDEFMQNWSFFFDNQKPTAADIAEKPKIAQETRGCLEDALRKVAAQKGGWDLAKEELSYLLGEGAVVKQAMENNPGKNWVKAMDEEQQKRYGADPTKSDGLEPH